MNADGVYFFPCRAERKLVKLYQEELQSAEKEMTKVRMPMSYRSCIPYGYPLARTDISFFLVLPVLFVLQVLEGEATRDEEMARLEARHARDKQLISALKLKIERLEMELVRAEDVPQHEAETYLDLLGGGPGGGGGTASGKNRTSSGRHANGTTRMNAGSVDSALDYDDDELERDSENDEEDRSMHALVAEQDALNGTWTKQMMEKEDKRRKLFAKKRNNQ